MGHLVLGLALARAAERYVFEAGQAAAAPDLLNPEVLSTIRAHERRGHIDRDRSREAVEHLLHLPVARYPSLPLLDRAWALRHDFGAYDATYVALAEALGMQLVTADGGLARAVQAHTEVPVVLLQ